MTTAQPLEPWMMKQGDRVTNAELLPVPAMNPQQPSGIILYLQDAAGNQGTCTLHSTKPKEKLNELDLELIVGATITICATHRFTKNLHLSFTRPFTRRTTITIDWIIEVLQ